MPAWAQVKSHLIKWPLLILLVSSFFLRDLVGGRFFSGKTVLLVCFLEVVAALRTLPSPRNAEQVTVADTALSWGESSPGRIVPHQEVIFSRVLSFLVTICRIRKP